MPPAVDRRLAGCVLEKSQDHANADRLAENGGRLCDAATGVARYGAAPPLDGTQAQQRAVAIAQPQARLVHIKV
jgi:hypothetical protein